MAAFLMKKYLWTAKKSLEYLKMKKNTIDLRESFFNQLIKYEDILRKQGKKLSKGWFPKQSSKVSPEELMMNNTYINTKMMNKLGIPNV